jgi:anion-transporting  ArsA/GET3 family ATPase
VSVALADAGQSMFVLSTDPAFSLGDVSGAVPGRVGGP